MILTKDNKLYLFGANNYYQLGILKYKNIYSPTSFENILKNQQKINLVNAKSQIIIMNKIYTPI